MVVAPTCFGFKDEQNLRLRIGLWQRQDRERWEAEDKADEDVHGEIDQMENHLTSMFMVMTLKTRYKERQEQPE